MDSGPRSPWEPGERGGVLRLRSKSVKDIFCCSQLRPKEEVVAESVESQKIKEKKEKSKRRKQRKATNETHCPPYCRVLFPVEKGKIGLNDLFFLFYL